jgi:hypothetical protein
VWGSISIPFFRQGSILCCWKGVKLFKLQNQGFKLQVLIFFMQTLTKESKNKKRKNPYRDLQELP